MGLTGVNWKQRCKIERRLLCVDLGRPIPLIESEPLLQQRVFAEVGPDRFVVPDGLMTVNPIQRPNNVLEQAVFA